LGVYDPAADRECPYRSRQATVADCLCSHLERVPCHRSESL